MCGILFHKQSRRCRFLSELIAKDVTESWKKGRSKVAWEPVEIASYWYRQIKIETEKY